jgi:hypothetical protein
MKIRELLQIVILSKKTIRKILVVCGIAFAVLFLSAGVLYEAEMHWLTPGERSTARAALVEINALQNAETMNGEEFDLAEKKAQQRFQAARDAKRTYRDQEVVAALSTYFILTTYRWDEARYELEFPVSSSEIDANRMSEIEHRQSDIETRKRLRSALHKELD